MIRLIASDMDGTLLEPNETLPLGLFSVVRQLKEMGINFAASSGRQFDNLRRLFSPVAGDICYICENGGLNAIGHEVVSTNPFERTKAMAIIKMLENFDLCILVSGVNCCYVSAEKRNFADDIIYRLRNTTAVVDRFERIPEDIVKISCFLESGIHPIAPKLAEKWGAEVNAVISGSQWFDFTMANKGTGIRSLMQRFGLERDEVVAFGDNFNDESMLTMAGHPFLMQNADPGLRKPETRICDKVLPVLESIVRNHGEIPKAI
ncbi:MAG: HAD family hydrolase [Eubacteriales bacterium]|nr:HAD family hydrolase [Eubacteriales bacterium]